MITRQRITSHQDPLFEKYWNLYLDAFPPEERREKDYQLETLSQEAYNLDAVLCDDQFIGFLCWWSFQDIRFIEHFATEPSVRGHGYGQETLVQFISEDPRIILLEVEPADNSIKHRRIEFYKRLNFILNDHPYSYPSYTGKGNSFVELYVMTYGQPISLEALQQFKDNCFPIIFPRHYK